MAVFNLRPSANARDIRIAKIIMQPEWSVRGHGDLVVHGVGSAAADSNDGEFGFRVDGADMNAIAGFAHFNLDFLRKVLCFRVGTGLHMNLRRDFQFTAGIAADVNLAHAMIEAEPLLAGQRSGLLKVACHLFLRGIARGSVDRRGQEQNG